MMEVEQPNDNIPISQANSSNDEMHNLSPTNDSSSYKKIIKELNYDIFPKYETFNFKKENYLTNPQSPIPEDVGIIIDNGSYECRAGWSICNEPNICCRNLLAKPKLNDGNFSPFIVGNSIFEYEQGKINKKSPFEKNIIAHFSTQEHIFDHIFSNLNINDNCINHPVLITESVCNLSFSRKCMTELMFELYGVPSLTYGIDMMFSYYYNNYENIKNNEGLGNCLIISSSNQVTHILPIIENKIDLKNTRRISIGSENAKDLLMKSLQLKYSDIKQKLTNEVIQEIYHNYTMAAIDYEQELKLIEVLHKDEQEKYHKLDLVNIYGTLDMYQKVMDSYKEEKRNNSSINNLNKKSFSYLKPYTNLVNYIDEEENNVEKNIINHLYFFKKPFMGVLPFITQEELKAKQEAKNEQILRFREIMKKRREENYKNMQIELEQLEKMIALKDQDKFKFEEMLTNTGYESAEEIIQRINKLSAKLNNDIHHLENTQPEDIESRWNLLSMPDEDLTEEQIKMKRIQKMQKNAYYSRLEKKELARKEKEKIEKLKNENKDKYLVSLYRTKKEILERLAKYEELKRDMVNRHSKTNMKRMQTLAELGKDSDGMERGGSNWEDDDFGKNDEDWEIYREVNKNNINEEEEEDYNRLHDIENQISEMDKNYFGNVQQYQYNFYHENDYFILGVDQFRCAELLFKPYIIGVEQAGIIEIISQIFKNMNINIKKNLAKNIFITGGNTYYPFLKERIYHDLRSYFPIDVDINVKRAANPVLDAWKGARLFFNDTYSLNGIKNNLRNNIYISKKEYEEYGVEYFKEHFCGNIKISN